MPKKKPLVENARPGLDALKSQLFQDMQKAPSLYRDRFRELARERVRTQTTGDPKSRPDR